MGDPVRCRPARYRKPSSHWNISFKLVKRVCDNVDNQVCAVIVTYNAAEALLDNIAAVRPQVSRMVIVDNASKPAGVNLVLRSGLEAGCEVILNDFNLGIAKALNAGIRYAESQACKEVVFFDQDSVVGDDRYIASMLQTYEGSNRSHRVAIVAPRYLDRASGATLPLPKNRDGNLLTAMTSGILVPIRIFETLGLHEESLYMDYVDTEFSLRCRRAGYAIVEAPGAILLHSWGRRTKHNLFGRGFSSTNHNANRRYYITRNRLLLMRRYWRDWRWFVREMRAFGVELFKIVLVEENKLEKLRHVKRGFADALSNKTGPRIAL